jgi:hypothetical protein
VLLERPEGREREAIEAQDFFADLNCEIPSYREVGAFE